MTYAPIGWYLLFLFRDDVLLICSKFWPGSGHSYLTEKINHTRATGKIWPLPRFWGQLLYGKKPHAYLLKLLVLGQLGEPLHCLMEETRTFSEFSSGLELKENIGMVLLGWQKGFQSPWCKEVPVPQGNTPLLFAVSVIGPEYVSMFVLFSFFSLVCIKCELKLTSCPSTPGGAWGQVLRAHTVIFLKQMVNSQGKPKDMGIKGASEVNFCCSHGSIKGPRYRISESTFQAEGWQERGMICRVLWWWDGWGPLTFWGLCSPCLL